MVSFIAKHHRSILNPNDQVYGCNCRMRNDCTLQHKCLTPGIPYQATVTNSNHDVEKIYYVYVKLPLRKGTKIIPVLLDMRKIDMKQNFPITSGHLRKIK